MRILSRNLQTISALFTTAEAADTAIRSVDGNEISYAQLQERIRTAHLLFQRRGLKKADIVATSLHNGPETAVTLLALLTYCKVAPLNPAYTLHESLSSLSNLQPGAVIASDGSSNASEGARQLDIPAIHSDEIAAQIGADPSPETVPELPGAEDIALLLYTSGTTAQPKLVPLTQRQLWMSAQAVRDTLQLSNTDRCLSMMPLFHIHGIVAGLLTSMAAGACVIATPGFQATRFFAWLRESGATWYTAVPTMHQAILARARHNQEILESHSLRLIRSSSSPLYPSVWEQLEQTFRVPVLNSYGMTEAAHQIASVRLEGARGQRNVVGSSSGPDIAIVDSDGKRAPFGVLGEVALRGEQIMTGYLQPAGANQTAFTDGWFLTGDQGTLGADGTLTLTGRLKELINSGGEKISPYEVEEALLAHPAVAQAIAFAAPHAMLGEQVVAAVVMVPGESISERTLLGTAGERLAPCKCPKQIFFVDELPRGATGKLQRNGLAKAMRVGS